MARQIVLSNIIADKRHHLFKSVLELAHHFDTWVPEVGWWLPVALHPHRELLSLGYMKFSDEHTLHLLGIFYWNG